MIISAVCDAVSGQRRDHPDLAERLLPFQPSVAEEAEVWLMRQ
jgi:hypothetical protein